MASDAPAELEILEELLQEMPAETDARKPCEIATQDDAVVSVAGADMSTEDVLEQLDQVTLSLDEEDDSSKGDGEEVDAIPPSTFDDQEVVPSEKRHEIQIALDEVSPSEERLEAQVVADGVAAGEEPLEAQEVLDEVSSSEEKLEAQVVTDEVALGEEPPEAQEVLDAILAEEEQVEKSLMNGTVESLVADVANADEQIDPEFESSPDGMMLTLTRDEEDRPSPTEHEQRLNAEAPINPDTVDQPAIAGDLLQLTSIVFDESIVLDHDTTTSSRLAEEISAMQSESKSRTGPEQSQPEVPGDVSSEEVVASAAISDSSVVDEVLPPPAPISTTLQAIFSGSLNPPKSPTDGVGDADCEDDSDSEDESDQVVPPPLSLEADVVDDDEELEVDTVVAEEIKAAKQVVQLAVEAAHEQPAPSSNPLRDALASSDSVSEMSIVGDLSKDDEIFVALDEPVEVRSAQVATLPSVHIVDPESSAVAFGIGYQSLRKRTDQDASGGQDEMYSIAKGLTFQDLEKEVTLSSDSSLSHRATDPLVATDEDEFGDIPEASDAMSPASPTHVEVILQKTCESMVMRSAEEVEAALVDEIKKATVHEKRHLHDAETSDSSKPVDDNALTLKELHNIYKRGLGDQEVRMLDNDDDSHSLSGFNEEHGRSATTSAPAPSLSVMGRILRKPMLTTHAITEEDENEQDEDETFDDEDANAVAVDNEKTAFAEVPPTSGKVEQKGDWEEIQLRHQTPSPPTTTQSLPAAKLDMNACSKITFAEALQHFLETEDVLIHRDRIVAEERPPSASCFGCFSRPRLAFSGAMEQRDRLFCVAATSFDPRNTIHVQILQTIYRRLMNGGSRDVPLIGTHWETVGFQGTDPSTDLRGCGMLSLLQMLYLVETHAEFVRRFHTVSQHPVRHFPLACALINITLQCLMSLRSGALYRESNKRGSVFDAANALHLAIASQLLKEIQNSSEEIPLVMKRVLECGRLYPDRVIEAHAASKGALESGEQKAATANVHQQRQSGRKSSGVAGRPSSSLAAGEFTEIGLHSIADD